MTARRPVGDVSFLKWTRKTFRVKKGGFAPGWPTFGRIDLLRVNDCVGVVGGGWGGVSTETPFLEKKIPEFSDLLIKDKIRPPLIDNTDRKLGLTATGALSLRSVPFRRSGEGGLEELKRKQKLPGPSHSGTEFKSGRPCRDENRPLKEAGGS